MGMPWIEKFMAPDGTSSTSREKESKVTVYGREGEKTVIRKAIERIQAGLKLEKTNSFEITRVAPKDLPRCALHVRVFPFAEYTGEAAVCSGTKTGSAFMETRAICRRLKMLEEGDNS